MIAKKKLLLLTIFLLVTIFSFWKKGQHDLQEWDESRNGVNAYEMLQNHDFVNLYYNGEVDTWNAKPPLMIWMIAGSYKIFGYNEFALRFPATLSIIVFFMLCFVIIRLLEDDLTAFLTCLILISCKAIFGNHVGLTGDFDAPLLVFLTASVYTFILYVEKQKKYAILITSIFTGLAFYTKGPASLVLVPGFLLFILLRKKTELFKDVRLWVSAAIFILIAGSWLLIASMYGKTSNHSYYGSKNSVETMLVYDTFQRLSNSKFDNQTHESDYMFFFEVIDARLNLWNYLFYLSLLAGIYKLYKMRRSFSNFINAEQHLMLLLSMCLILPLSLVLTVASSKNNWYLAPLYLFIAFITAKGILFFERKWRPFYLITGCLLVFNMGRQLYYIYTLPTEFHDKLSHNADLKNNTVFFTEAINQNVLLYLKWLGVSLVHKDTLDEIAMEQGKLAYVHLKTQTEIFPKNVVKVVQLNNYFLLKISDSGSSSVKESSKLYFR